MHILLISISLVLIALVLLQSGKAESSSGIVSSSSEALFANRKERGGELFITRLTLILGAAFMIICLIQGF